MNDTNPKDPNPVDPSPEEAVLAGRITPAGEVTPPHEDELPQFVTRLTPIEQQVGVNVIAALQHPETVAVLSSVSVGGDGAQHIVSVGLDPELLGQIQEMLRRATEKTPENPSVRCFGFQCHLAQKDNDESGQDPSDG